MTVSASLIEMLETNNIAYQLKASQLRLAHMRAPKSGALHPCSVKSLLMQDAQGRVQVLLPSDHMLDLSAIQSQFGRNLSPLSRAETESLLGESQLQSIPGIPAWANYTTFVDASLLLHPTLWLDSGDSDQILEIQLTDFQNIIKNACIGELAVPTPSVPDSSEMDKEQIVHSVKQFTKHRIKQRLEETLELPPLPETAQRIIALRADPESDISDLSDIVELDPALAAQVVSWASSPYYSAPGKIKSVHDAIVRVLGFDMVMNLALGLALGKTFNNSVITSEHLREYWQRSVCMAATVEGLVTSIPREHRPGFGMAYLSGLLHNFGYLVLADVFPPYFANLARHYDANPHIPHASIEQHLIGVSNCQVAAWLLEYWHMPEEVVTAIRNQNNPNCQGEHSAYPKLLYVATQLLAQKGFANGAGNDLPDSIFEELHLDRGTAEITVENIVEASDDLDAIAEKMQG